MSFYVEGLWTDKEGWDTPVIPSGFGSKAAENGSEDQYIALLKDDWYGDEPATVKFTITVEGWYDSASAVENRTFTVQAIKGNLLPEDETPAPPAGSVDNPKKFTPKETSAPEKEWGEISDSLQSGEYYLTTSVDLIAGHKYFFGVKGSTTNALDLVMHKPGSKIDVLSTNGKPYTNVWTECSSAYSIVVKTTGKYNFVISSSDSIMGDSFKFYHAVMKSKLPAEHKAEKVAVGSATEFTPGYMNNPMSGAYDDVIDDVLFAVTNIEKNGSYVFETTGGQTGTNLLLRLYDKAGTILAESRCVATNDFNVRAVWKAPSNYSPSSGFVYVGVCQLLGDEDEETPSAPPLQFIVRKVNPDTSITPLVAVPGDADTSPVSAYGAEPVTGMALSSTAWTNTYVIAARAGVTYAVKAVSSDASGLALSANVYTINSQKKPETLGSRGSIDPGADGWLTFTPTANAQVYIDVAVADGTWGTGAGLDYGPYDLYASGWKKGVTLSPLKVTLIGAPLDQMTWQIGTERAVQYLSGATVLLPAGEYAITPVTIKNYATPVAGKVTVPDCEEFVYKYTDSFDPLDDSPDTKKKHPTLNKAYAPAKLSPSAKGVAAPRSLWSVDEADWFTFSASDGTNYKFSLSDVKGDPEVRVYGPNNWESECEYSILTNVGETVQVSAEKGTYYVRVAHADAADPADSAYTLTAFSVVPGVVKIAKPAVSVKDSAGYADISVSRTGKDGVVRVKYRTEGAQTDADDAYYYPTSGVLEWAANDNKAKTVRVKLVPYSGWDTNKVVKVVFSAFSPDDESFDRSSEYVAQFEKDKKTGLPIDTATITVTASAKKAPGTIQVAGCETPKKPVLSVKAGKTVDVPFERVLGADGVVGVKVETVKGTANKSGEVDFAPVVTNFVWAEGESAAQTVSVATKAVAGDYTAVKTFTLKLTALTSKTTDAVQYDKPTLASATVTVNILNNKFAEAFDAYAKTVTDAAYGYTVKEGKKGTWVVMADGSYYAPNGGDLTFTFKTTGTFRYTVDSVAKTFTATAKEKTLKIPGATTFSVDGYDLDGETVALRQGVKYEASFGTVGTVKASNLPAGLKLAQDKKTKEWTVAGTPSKAGIFQAVYTTTVDKNTPAVTSNICYTVAAEGTAAGTFNGLVSTDDTTNGVAKLASVTITAALGGKLSASVNIAGKKYTFTDAGYESCEPANPGDPESSMEMTAALSLVQKIGSGKTATSVTNWLYYTVADVPETDPSGWLAKGSVVVIMAALPDAKGGGYQEDVKYTGSVYRDNSKSGKDGKAAWEAAMAAHAGYFTVSLVAPYAMSGEPCGSGYMTMTLDAKGKAKLAGKLADGTAYSGSATATLAGDALSPSVRVPLFAQKASWVFGGWLSVKVDGSGVPVAEIDPPDTDLVWRSDDPAATRDGKEGFDLEIVPVGGWYDTVSNLQRSYLETELYVYLPEGEEALDNIKEALVLGDGYEFKAQPSDQAVDLMGNTLSVAKQTLVKDASTKLVDWDASVNASNVKLTFKRATGIVSGSFDLWYEGVNAKGATEQKSVAGLKHEGVLVLSRGDEGLLLDYDVLSSGFFLAPQTFKETVGKKTVTRKWNGSYRFDIHATPAAADWADAAAE